MADISTTVSAMPKEKTSPVAPPTHDEGTKLTEELIRQIAEELAQPWQYGFCLFHVAQRFGVPIKVVWDIHLALMAKQKVDNPVVIGVK